MGKTDPFTQFHPVLPNRFYPVGKTYHANIAKTCKSWIYLCSKLQAASQNLLLIPTKHNIIHSVNLINITSNINIELHFWKLSGKEIDD